MIYVDEIFIMMYILLYIINKIEIKRLEELKFFINKLVIVFN